MYINLNNISSRILNRTCFLQIYISPQTNSNTFKFYLVLILNFSTALSSFVFNESIIPTYLY